jgi:2-polyprenyl-3-methyl-5-hydroxy-6-metoxy-1,4-benzoquinol methylase
MPSFTQRSDSKELLDATGIPFADIRQNMQELDFINTWLGGHAITLKGLKSFLPAPKNEWHITEIGCGGGDNLRVIKNWAEKRGYKVQLTGVDINPECIQFAGEKEENKGIHFICSDYRTVLLQSTPDIIFSSLFCHHFQDEELLKMLQWMKSASKTGFFINDLHRHPLAYYSIRGLTAAFSKSYLVKNDAPLSVQRGFVRHEWELLFQKAGITNYTCTWQWAFRWLVTYRHV